MVLASNLSFMARSREALGKQLLLPPAAMVNRKLMLNGRKYKLCHLLLSRAAPHALTGR
jgi:hypothetical protein